MLSDTPSKTKPKIKRYLEKFFAEKAIDDADKIWDEKGYTNETMRNWLNEDNEEYGK